MKVPKNVVLAECVNSGYIAIVLVSRRSVIANAVFNFVDRCVGVGNATRTPRGSAHLIDAAKQFRDDGAWSCRCQGRLPAARDPGN